MFIIKVKAEVPQTGLIAENLPVSFVEELPVRAGFPVWIDVKRGAVPVEDLSKGD